MRRQGRGHAAGRAAPGHRQGGRREQEQACHPPVTRGKERPQADGRNAEFRITAELAAVYDCQPQPRTLPGVITPPGRQKPARPPWPKATGKWLTASVTSDIAGVIAAGFDEAERRDPHHRRTWVALADGNNAQIDAVEAEAARRGVSLTILCDFVHVIEYCWKAAWSFFEPGDADAETWVAGKAAKILQGNATQVAAGIRRRATTYGYNGKEREGADTCAAYLTAKKDYLDYAPAREKGWPIRPRDHQGACRYIIGQRLKLSGMHRTAAGAEAILRLRALIANGDFDRYWRYHLRKEHERVRRARYRESYVLAA